MGLSTGVSALAQLADQVQQVNARLKLAVSGAREFAEAQRFAYRVAAQTGAGFEAVATLYARLAQAASSFGLSQEQIARTTEATALALKVSGASAAEAASVVRQFSQALGSGVLRGDEFNSIMENGGRLAKALADGLGLPVGRLRELAEQGLLTTDVITRALDSQRDALQREAAAMPRTIGQALSQVRDEFARTVDRMNQSVGATRSVAQAFDALARNIDAVIGTAAVAAIGALTAAMVRGGQAAVAYAQQMFAKIAADRQAIIAAQALAAHEVAKAQAMVASAQAAVAAATGMARLSVVQTELVPAQQRLAAAQAQLNATMAAGGAVARGVSVALGFLGGPLGAILTLLSMGATAWALWGSNAESAGERARRSAEAAEEVLRRMDREQRFGSGDAAALREEIERLKRVQDELNEELGQSGSSALLRAIEANQQKLKRYEAALVDIERKQKEVLTGGSGPTELGKELLGKSFDKFLEQFRRKVDPLGEALRELREQAERAAIPLDSPRFREAEALVRKALAGESRLPTLRRPLEDDLQALQAALKAQADVVETALAARLIKVEDFWRAKAAIDDRAFSVERDKLSRELAAQEDLIARLSSAKPKDANQRAEIADRLNDARIKAAALRAELDALNGREVAAKFRLEIDRAKALREIRDAVEDAKLAIAKAEGTDTPEMRRAAVERALRDTVDRLAQDAEGAQLARRLIDIKAAEADLTALESRWRLALETMRSAEQSAAIQREQGLISTAQAQQAIADAHRQAAQEMQQLLPLMERAAQTIGREAVARVQAWKNELASVRDVVDPLAAAIGTQIKDAFASMFEAVGSGAKTARQAFADFVRSVVAGINRIAAQNLAEAIFGPKGGGAQSFIAGALKFFGFSSGGPVPGSGTRDTVPAMLTPGEYVIRRDVAQRIGRGLLDAINGGAWLPRIDAGRLAFASGGMVPQVAQPSVSQSVRVVNVVDPRMAADWMDSPAGERVLLNVIGRNASAVRTLLAGA